MKNHRLSRRTASDPKRTFDYSYSSSSSARCRCGSSGFIHTPFINGCWKTATETSRSVIWAATLQRTPVGTKRLARRGYLALRVLNRSFPAIRAKWLAKVTATQPQCRHLHCGCQGSRGTRTRCCVSRLSNSRLQNKFCDVQVFNFLLVWCELAT